MVVSRLFPPETTCEQLTSLLDDTLRSSPRQYDHNVTRWTLSLLRRVLDPLKTYTLAGLHGLLDRLGFSFKKGRLRLHSPDPDYIAKRDYVQARLAEVGERGDERLFYCDGVHIQHGPKPAGSWGNKGADRQPLELGTGGKRSCTWMGALCPFSGEVTTKMLRRSSRGQFLSFLRHVRERYSESRRIWVVVDNYSIHFHADVLKQLEEQVWPWEWIVPKHYPKFDEKTRVKEPMAIQLVPLPTYSPWLNPIEKLWKMLRQRLVYNHPWGGKPNQLIAAINEFFKQLRHGSEELLRYVGLSPS